ncbi:hypothetical protein ANN_18100 [Periplaneta americana]|uniref:Uncharacterized protein n=1 Tax=Periplaneta americana TaxID=6978 RepID=A0ABQ8SNS3_PERAM|nr:hypothetical protein ANN_18100 [Periplaneta americana]
MPGPDSRRRPNSSRSIVLRPDCLHLRRYTSYMYRSAYYMTLWPYSTTSHTSRAKYNERREIRTHDQRPARKQIARGRRAAERSKGKGPTRRESGERVRAHLVLSPNGLLVKFVLWLAEFKFVTTVRRRFRRGSTYVEINFAHTKGKRSLHRIALIGRIARIGKRLSLLELLCNRIHYIVSHSLDESHGSEKDNLYCNYYVTAFTTSYRTHRLSVNPSTFLG